ncbi:MAG: biotin/lipoyl-containing protein [Minisyncoccia bacterium]
MIRKFKVNIGGKVYNVEIEEIFDEKSSGSAVKSNITTTPEPNQIQLSKPPKEDIQKGIKGEAIVSPMPAKVVSLKCRVGDRVKRGDTLIVIDAMKMEHNITSPRDGVILEIKTTEGASVSQNQPLIVIG